MNLFAKRGNGCLNIFAKLIDRILNTPLLIGSKRVSFPKSYKEPKYYSLSNIYGKMIGNTIKS